MDRPGDMRTIAEVIASTNRARDGDFLEGLRSEGSRARFLRRAKRWTPWRGEMRSSSAPRPTSR